MANYDTIKDGIRTTHGCKADAVAYAKNDSMDGSIVYITKKNDVYCFEYTMNGKLVKCCATLS